MALTSTINHTTTISSVRKTGMCTLHRRNTRQGHIPSSICATGSTVHMALRWPLSVCVASATGRASHRLLSVVRHPTETCVVEWYQSVSSVSKLHSITQATMTTSSPSGALYLADDAAYDKKHFLVPHHYEQDIDSVLIPAGLIQDRVEKLAQDIRYAYEGKTIHLLCVLKGGSAFFHNLVEKLRLFHKYNKCDYVPFTFDFIKVKSYEGTQSTGNVQISGADASKFKGKDLLLVEDIIDTGKTMAKLIPYLQQYEPASVRVASLLEKRNPASCGFQGDFVGFSIPDKFVIGYCLDYNEMFRDLDHICVISETGIAKYASHS